MGRSVLDAPDVMRLRPLMPLLVAPERTFLDSQKYYGIRWAWYQTLRFLIFWIALWTDATAFGAMHAAVVAGLVGLTLRFDYWSNAIELLAAVVVAASGALGIHWGWGLLLGVVFGAGRETIPLLGLASFSALPVALGAAATQGALRRWTKQGGHWGERAKTTEYGDSQIPYNLTMLTGPRDWASGIHVAVYVLLACLAAVSAPLLTVVLVALTFWKAKIDEPRVLTMLVPFAAMTVCAALK